MDKITLINLNCSNNLDFESINIDSVKDLKVLNNIKTKYAMFYNNGSKYKNVDFEKIISFMESNNISLYGLCPCYETNKRIEKLYGKKEGFITHEDEIYNFDLDSYIIDTKLLKGLSLSDNYEEELLIHILEKTNKYYQSKSELLIKDYKIYKDVAKYPKYHMKEWYLSDIKNSLIPILKKYNNHYVMNLVFNLYLLRLLTNYQQSTLNIMDDKEYEEYLNISKELLDLIDDDILSCDNFTKNLAMNPNILDYVLKIKYKGLKYEVKDNYLVYKTCKFLNLNDYRILVNTMNNEGDKVLIDLTIDYNLYNSDKLKILVDGKNREYKETHIYAKQKLFGKTYYDDVTLQFEIDLKKDKKVIFETNSGKRLKLRFSGMHSKITERYGHSYWNVKDRYIKYRHHTLLINKRNIFTTFTNELKFWLNIIKNDGFKKAKHGIVLRALYFLTKPKYSKRNIWITYDKVYKSGDCGEYLYRYIVKHHEIYYIISPKAKYYKKIKDETKNVLEYGSRKSKLMVLHSKKIFATDSLSVYFCGFSAELAIYCRGLFNFEVNCIQHGLTMQDIAFRQNRLFDNIKKYYIASKYEEMNLLKEEYGYKKDQIIKTGIARFDGLHNKPENTILLSPTWRVNVASNLANDRVRKKNNTFKETSYFKVYNSLINNKELLDVLKKNKYRIVFLIHPTLISNKDDYDKNELVDIISSSEVNYEDMLTTSKVMITDYSGVQYDFAYMKKPIIYYHTPLLPPSYDNGMMDYEKIGFGPICDTEDKVVSELIKLINNKAKTEEKYVKRIKDFFLFDDFNSSKRIYEDAIKK